MLMKLGRNRRIPKDADKAIPAWARSLNEDRRALGYAVNSEGFPTYEWSQKPDHRRREKHIDPAPAISAQTTFSCCSKVGTSSLTVGWMCMAREMTE